MTEVRNKDAVKGRLMEVAGDLTADKQLETRNEPLNPIRSNREFAGCSRVLAAKTPTPVFVPLRESITT